jgi:FixJ family two-component response regulator
VVVSADVQSSSHDLVHEAGGKAFLNKPFDRTELIHAVQTALAGAA